MMEFRKPLISIIVTVFNTEAYLKRCLNSLIYQSYYFLEIIIIDDGSTDSSIKICSTYAKKDERIKLYTQENKGPAAASNNGLTRVKGEWIYFVDSDDWIDKDGLEGIVCMINKYPQAELIRCFNRRVFSESEVTLNVKYHKETIYSPIELISAGLMGGYKSSLFIKSNILKDNLLMFDEDLQIKEDMEFTFRVVLSCNWILVYNKIFYNYFIRSTSQIHKYSFLKAVDNINVPKKIYLFSLKYDNKAIRRFVYKKLNEGLTVFLLDIFKNEVISDTRFIKSNNIRKIINSYIKKTNLHICKRTIKNNILLLVASLPSRFQQPIIKYLLSIKKGLSSER